MIKISDYVLAIKGLPFDCEELAPWELTLQAERILRDAQDRLNDTYIVEETIAVHKSATIETGAILKGPVIIGPNCFVAANAYLRGGVYLGPDCIVGPSCELKSTFMFARSKIAHLSFVGDSIIGSEVNIEAGAVIANYRNELEDKIIRIQAGQKTVDTNIEKFGALIGDRARIGAHAVIAPGALIEPGFIVPRLGLVDQSPN